MAKGYDADVTCKIFHETYQDSASWRRFANVPPSPQPEFVWMVLVILIGESLP